MRKSTFRGHAVFYDEDTWRYLDTLAPAGFGKEVRPCKKCGRLFEGSNIDDADTEW